jgi:hypothetical protein
MNVDPPRPEPVTAFSDSDQGVNSFRPSASDRADASIEAGVAPSGMAPASIYSPGTSQTIQGKFTPGKQWGQVRRAIHKVADIHYGPGISPGGPSWLRCTCGVQIRTKTAEAIYPAWVKHGGRYQGGANA